MKLRIAICVDDKKDIDTLWEYIEKYDSSIEKRAFGSAEELLDTLDGETYDLIFLDIQMKLLNGFDAAKIIMERFSDRPPLIVFTTMSSKYTIRGYEVAFRYLMKPVKYEEFSDVLSAAWKKIMPKRLQVRYDGRTFIIPVDEILYCEVCGHNTKIHTVNSTYEIRSPLKTIEESLEGGGFARPHGSYLVNLDQIISASQSEIVLKNGLTMKISRYRRDEFLKAFHNFLRR
jgi:DNA-binding LytR/AlgR family response regulator